METKQPHDRPKTGWTEAFEDLRQFLLFNPERDSRFRQEIVVVSRRSVRRCCALGFGIILCYTAIAVFGQDRTLAWTRGLSPYVSGLDKLILFVFIAGAFASSYTEWGVRHARLIVGFGIVLVGFTETSFDSLNDANMDFSTPWLAVMLMVGLGTMPFRASQALALGIAMFLVYPVVVSMGPKYFGAPETITESSQMTFMAIMVFLGTSVSGFLFRNRYRSFSQQENLREARDRIMEQADSLQELDRIKARFFANLSHEFRTPLTLMLGPVDDALTGHSGVLSPKLRYQLDIARRNGYRMKQLINQLLDLSRLEAGRMELELGMYDLVSFARRLNASFSTLAETKQIQLSFHSDTPSLNMAFDSDKVEKICSNLLSNALKFTPAGGKVHLSIGRDAEGKAVISVKDTGPGLAPEQCDRIFERFFQVGDGKSDVQAGTGIGLALVKELTALHGGTIRVESQVGFGSEFIVELPFVVTGEEEADVHAASILEDGLLHVLEYHEDDDHLEAEAIPADAPLVMIADDNDDVRAYLRSHLEKRYRIVEAVDGDDAVRLLKEELPVLVLSDVMMPGIDGHELCRLIKSDERTNHIPVILVTAKASEESRREGLEAGADDYLFKPFNASDLMIRAENLIEIRRVLRERFSGEYVIKPTDVTVNSAEAEFLNRLQVVVEEHIGDTNFGVEWLASEVGISPRQLQRRLRSSIGLSAAGFVRTLRLQRASQLIEAKAGTVSEIAYRVGFLDANYFSRLFKQTFGTSPSEFNSGS